MLNLLLKEKYAIIYLYLLYFTQQSQEKIYYFFWRGCVNLQIILGGNNMAKVIVFEKNGEVRLATLIDDQNGVFKSMDQRRPVSMEKDFDKHDIERE